MQTSGSRAARSPISGMRAFSLIWLGQFVSLLGTGMSRFALTLWAWELTGSATALALVGLFSFAPGIILSPIAGTLVDRWDRKLMVMMSDLGAGVSTIAIFWLYLTGSLQIWHLYVAGAFASAFESFQFPAYSAAVTTMLHKDQYARASGMMGLAENGTGIIAPFLAGALFAVIGLQGILLFDILSFMFAIAMVMLTFIPKPQQTAAGIESRSGGLFQEVSYGFTFIFRRPSLLGLQLTFFFINFTATFSGILFAPMILARTNSDELTLSVVTSFFGIGGVAGSLLLSVWGGPRRKVHGVLIGIVLSSLLGTILMGGAAGIILWSVGAFFSSFFIPVLNGSNQAIWQAKVAPDVQGRVFATRRLIGQITVPVSMALAGPLADNVFEPAMREGGSLAAIFGRFIGTGPGTGMAVMVIITGVLGVMVGFGGYLFPAVRNAETILPDHTPTPTLLPGEHSPTVG